MKKLVWVSLAMAFLLAGCGGIDIVVGVSDAPPVSSADVPSVTDTRRPATSAPERPAATSTPTQTPNATSTPIPSPTRTPSPTPLPTATPTPIPVRPPTRIVIPSIALDAPIKAVGLVREPTTGFWTYDIPAYRAVGWHDDTATLGMPGNTVLNGHNNILGYVFIDLVDVKKGDVITLYSNNTPFKYVISEVLFLLEAGQPEAVRIKNASYILPTSDARLTIVSCWPRNSNTHRLIVIARPA